MASHPEAVAGGASLATKLFDAQVGGALRSSGQASPPLRCGTRCLVADGDGGRGEEGAEVAGGESVQGAEAGFEFGRGYAAQAIEAAEKIVGGAFSLVRVALDAAGDEIAVGVAPPADMRDDMVEAAHSGGELAQAIEAEAPLARVNGLAAAFALQEIDLFQANAGAAGLAGQASGHDSAGDRSRNFIRQADLDGMAGSRALDQAQSPLGDQAANGSAHGSLRDMRAVGEPAKGKAKLGLAFEAAMPEEMGIDDAVDKIEAQAGHEIIFELFPDEVRIGFFVLHGLGSRKS